MSPFSFPYVGRKNVQDHSKTAHPGKGTILCDGINNLSFSLTDSGAFKGTFPPAALVTTPLPATVYDGFAAAGFSGRSGSCANCWFRLRELLERVRRFGNVKGFTQRA